jgi:hypothetical protein
MTASGGWQNPIKVGPGSVQGNIEPTRLRPGREDLIRARLEFQHGPIRSRRPRFTSIQASRDGVIIDGHHSVRAAAAEGQLIEVYVSSLSVVARAVSILDLPVR